MVCRSCGRENLADASFCGYCGPPLQADSSCLSCGTINPAEMRFCHHCGAALVPTSPLESAPAAPPVAPAYPISAEVVELLGRVSLFQYLESDALDHLAIQIRIASFPEGPIVRERDTTADLFIIKSGMVKVSKSARGEGSEVVLALLRPGETFGELRVIDGLPRSADVTVMQPTECYVLEREAFLATLERHPEIARGMLPSLTGIARRSTQAVADIL